MCLMFIYMTSLMGLHGVKLDEQQFWHTAAVLSFTEHLSLEPKDVQGVCQDRKKKFTSDNPGYNAPSTWFFLFFPSSKPLNNPERIIVLVEETEKYIKSCRFWQILNSLSLQLLKPR